MLDCDIYHKFAIYYISVTIIHFYKQYLPMYRYIYKPQ